MRENVNIDTASEKYIQTCSGAETADYRKRLAEGLYLNPLPYRLTIFKQPGPTRQTTIEWFRGEAINRYFSSATMADNHPLRTTALDHFSRNVMNDVTVSRRNKLLAKIQGQSLPLLMLYKERKQTNDLIIKFLDDALFCAKNIRNPRAILKRYRWKQPLPPGKTLKRLRSIASQGTSRIGDVWLQYRFAWSPLLNDIEVSLNAAAAAEKKGKLFKARAGTEFASTFVRSKHNQDGVTGPLGTVTREGYYGLWTSYLINDATLAALAQISNAEFTLWDGIPYSFVIDRLVNVGQWLDLRYATAGVIFEGGCETTFYKDHFNLCAHELYSSYGETLSSIGVYGFEAFYSGPPRTDIVMNRVVMSSFPRPELEYPYKDFANGPKRIMDYAALIRQRFKLKV